MTIRQSFLREFTEVTVVERHSKSLDENHNTLRKRTKFIRILELLDYQAF